MFSVTLVALGGLVVTVIVTGSKVRGFKTFLRKTGKIIPGLNEHEDCKFGENQFKEKSVLKWSCQ
jgi:hypothetical protein